MPFGAQLPEIRVPPPGPRSRAMSERLGAVESRNVTYRDERWPVFWDEALGANVRDVDGNVYVDLTSAFGVALLGHRPPSVVRAIEAQSGRLVHGMGDIHPPAPKVELLEQLTALMPWAETKAILCGSGSEAVEAALKTAQIASGRPGILAFEGSYHGLTLGSLAATDREHFRGPFTDRLFGGVAFAPWPSGDPAATGDALAGVRAVLEGGAPNGDPIGTVVIEPVQARGGCRVPPQGFMEGLSELAAELGVLVVADEIFTGLGRCGAMLASQRVGLRPDVVCVGKALGGGMPISACLAPRSVMDAWPPSSGEAIHTSTFLGHPLACATAIASLEAIVEQDVPAESRRRGDELLERLSERLAARPGVRDVRGMGLLVGVELAEPGAGGPIAEAALARGVLVLPAGATGEVVELAPPVCLTRGQTEHALDVLCELIEESS